VVKSISFCSMPALKSQLFSRFTAPRLSMFWLSIAILALFEGYAISALLLTVALMALQWALGAEVARWLLGRPLTSLEVISLGGAIGMLGLVATQQLLVQISLTRFSLLPVLLVMVLAMRRIRRGQPLVMFNSLDSWLVLGVAGVGFFHVAPGWTWPSLAGVTSLLLLAIASSTETSGETRRRLPLRTAVGTIFSLATAIAIFVDKQWNGPREPDLHYFEAMGALIAGFGASEASPSLSAESMSQYHWLASGWIGIVTRFSDSAPFLFQVQVASFLAGAIWSAAIAQLCSRIGANARFGVMAAALCIGAGGNDLVFYSLPLSQIFLVAMLLLVADIFRTASLVTTTRLAGGLLLLATAATFAKGPSLLTVLAMMAVVGLVDLARQPSLGRLGVWLGVAAACPLFSYLKYFPSNYDEIAGSLPLESIRSLGLNEGLWVLRDSVAAFVPMTIFVLWSIFSSRQNATAVMLLRGFRVSLPRVIAGVAAFSLLSALLLWLVYARPAIGVALATAGFVSQVIAAVLLARFASSRTDKTGDKGEARRLWPWTMLPVIIASVGLSMLLQSEFWKSEVVNRLWTSRLGGSSIGRWVVWLVVDQPQVAFAIVAVAFSYIVIRFIRSATRPLVGPSIRLRTTLFASGMAVMLVLGATSSWLDKASYNLGLRSSDTVSSGGEDINRSARRSAEIIALGEFVRTNTKESAVFATNNFCCFGERWLIAPTSRNRQSVGGGANYQLGAETRRRFLIQGPFFLVAYRPNKQLSTDEYQRLTTSLSFANSPTLSDIETLREYGVEYYIVNLRLTARRDWTGYGTELFRGQEFAILRLN